MDVTGCGNAFCGGFLAGLDAGLGVLDSARWGCVAGSIMAEWQGVPAADAIWEQLVQQAAAKHVLLHAAGFEASTIDEGLAASSPQQVVPAASSTAVHSMQQARRGGGALLSAESRLPKHQLGHCLAVLKPVTSFRRDRSSRAARACLVSNCPRHRTPRVGRCPIGLV